MSILWLEESNDWSAMELVGSTAFRLSGGSRLKVEPIGLDQVRSSRGNDIVLCKTDTAGSQWAIISRPSACCINGEPLATGIRCLAHRDEIVLSQCPLRLLFSNEHVATVTTHRAESIKCPRCTKPILDGSPVVVCPNCGIAHHQDPTESRACWTYSEKCTVCQHSTALDAGYTWPPEGW